jgi:CRP-like cAMP-binding protein
VDKYSKQLQAFPVLLYKKGEVIVSQGEIPRKAFMVRKGIIKTYNLSSEGDEKLVDFGIKYDFFPDAWIFSKSSAALYFYEAMTDCYLYVIPQEKIIQFIDENPDFQRMVMEKYISNYIAQTLRINALTYSQASSKLLHTLRYLCIRFGMPREGDTVELSLRLTHQQFSRLVGLSRETTTKTLIQLKNSGILSYDKSKIIVNLHKLSMAIGDSDFDNLKIDNESELTN